jgi:ribonuclease/clavin/mitogillin
MRQPLTIDYGSTHHYLIDCRGGKLLIDAGWAGGLAQLRAGLRRYDIELASIKYVMLTHSHPDHAGATQEVKRAAGARLVIHERQIPFLAELAEFYRGKGGYEPISIEKDDIIIRGEGPAGGRAVQQTIGVAGKLVPTPGHSDDSVSLALDDGRVFIGDLHLPNQVDAAHYPAIAASWHTLIDLGAQTAYPSHADPISVAGVAALLE